MKILITWLFAACMVNFSMHTGLSATERAGYFTFDVHALMNEVADGAVPLGDCSALPSFAQRVPAALYNGLDPKRLASLLADLSGACGRGELPGAEISYLVADIKVNDGGFKVLELGEGKNSERLSPEGCENWRSFCQAISGYGLPVFYVGPLPESPLDVLDKQREIVSRGKKTPRSLFKPLPRAHCFASLGALERSSIFKRYTSAAIKSPACMARYAGIVVYKYRDDRDPMRLKGLELFKSKYKNFLFLDRVSRPYAANKMLFDLLMRSSAITAAYRPQCKFYVKGCSKELMQQIACDIDADWFVIKPINSSVSNGIIVSSREQLEADLQRIFGKKYPQSYNAHPYSFNYRPAQTVSYAYWLGDTNSIFLVEAYAPSRDFIVQKRHYDPTMRVAFMLSCDQGVITVNFLQSSLKLPRAALDDDAALTAKHVSVSREHTKTCTAVQRKIIGDEMSAIYPSLAHVMAQAYARMLYVHEAMQ